MYMASHIISTVLESAIVLGKGSDCIHKPEPHKKSEKATPTGRALHGEVKAARTFMLHSATTDTLEHMLV